MVSAQKEGKSITTKAFKVSTTKWIGFDTRYEQCKEFRKKYGHCKIPTKYKTDKSFGIWVQEMRRNYKLQMTGKKPRKALDQAHITKLNEIEFHWGFTPDPNKSPELDASWETNLQALKDYHKSHGNFDVPMEGEFTEFGKWVRVQRNQKYYRDTKRKCFISKERIKKLDGIGFNWKGSRKLDE